MFGKEKTNSPERLSNNATLISEGTVLHGDIKSNHDLRIDGTVHGNVYCTSKIVVGPSGVIEGNMEGRQADITGKVQGNIVVAEVLQLRSDCNVVGDISAETLQVDPAAVFNGKCKMGKPATGSVKQASANGKQANGNIVVMNNADEAKVALP